MSAGHERRLRSGQSLALVDLVQSVFAAELLSPSRPLWIASPWISNVELIDNSGRQFSGLVPIWPPRPIRLIDVLGALLQRGGALAVVTRDVEINRPFIQEFASVTGGDPRASLILTDVIHEKGITGESFTLDGSMNLTYTGLRIKEEYVVFSTDPEIVARRRLEFLSRWKDRL
jgi:hypothetical protein